MIFKDILPSAPLSPIVKYYRLRHFIVPKDFDSTSQPKAFVPIPEQCIALYPRGYEITVIHNTAQRVIKPRAVLSGQYSHRIDRSSGTSEFLMIQIVFRAGALYKLIGIPSHEFRNCHIDLQDIYSKEVKLLNEQLCNCGDYNAMIALVEMFLLYLKDRQKIDFQPFERIFSVLGDSSKKFCLNTLASQACLSTRQFERRINDYLGISPHLYARIARFSQTYRMKEANPRLDWLSIACLCGYYDYQQLSKEYLAFTGETPNRIFQFEQNTLEKVLGLKK